MNVEEDSDAEVWEESLPVSFAGLKAEHNVSFVPVCMHCWACLVNIQNRVLFSHFHSCVSVHPHERIPVM
jgi:hypothetical protein